MSDLSITDSVGNAISTAAVKWSSPSSLFTYLKSESLHLIVVPDFVQRKDQLLTLVAPTPQTFKLSVQHTFQIGTTVPEITFKPSAVIELFVNATNGSDLFEGDSFHLPANVPAQTGYVGLSLAGALDLGVSGSSGDLSFGIDKNRGITLEFLKAFPLGQGQPTLWTATAAMISDFVIPASVDELVRLNPNDVCFVSGQGSLKISGSVKVALPVNPLASVTLPLDVGTLAIQDGLLTGLSVSLTLSGSYQIRLEKLPAGAVRLSYLRQAGTALKADLSASAGVAINLGTTDLIAKLLGAISTDKLDPSALSGLNAHEVATFNSAIKECVDHSLRASLDGALSESVSNQIAFQYEIQLDLLDAASTEALNRALKGDLTLLTAMEEQQLPDGAVAAGIKLLNSVFKTTKEQGFSLKVNLLGIVNLISTSKLVNQSEFVYEPASGDLTIKVTAEGDRISAITNLHNLQQALRKALFNSVLVTTTYLVSKTVSMPVLACEAVHFATDHKASIHTIADYINWFLPLNLLKPDEKPAIITGATGGPANCIVRATLDDSACESMFFDASGEPRTESDYQEIGRRALQELLDPIGEIDKFRYKLLEDDSSWEKAVQIGPNPALADLIPLHSTDSQFSSVLNDVSGDLYDILWWASSMVKAGVAIHEMRAFFSGRDPASIADDPAFVAQRSALQKVMLGVVAHSKLRFEEPLGMICLYRAAGSRQSSGKLVSPTLTLQRQNRLT